MVYTVDVEVADEKKTINRCKNKTVSVVKPKRYQIPETGEKQLHNRPVIIGAGPAGLFAAYLLAKEGYQPLLLERGKKVEDRTKDVEAFWKTGKLDPGSNVQFGEGGAGTFSDGKLNTLVKDPIGRNQFVLETFVKFGAPEHILYESKPHIGTDVLAEVIAAMRNEIIRLGGEVRFETCMTGIQAEKGNLFAIATEKGEVIETEVCILAPGHSARDTFEMLEKTELHMEPKAFAVGFRVEHPQQFINQEKFIVTDLRLHRIR